MTIYSNQRVPEAAATRFQDHFSYQEGTVLEAVMDPRPMKAYKTIAKEAGAITLHNEQLRASEVSN